MRLIRTLYVVATVAVFLAAVLATWPLPDANAAPLFCSSPKDCEPA